MSRLPVEVVQRLETLLCGDPATEEAILAFIRHQYGARSLVDLAQAVATEIARRPYDFVQAAKRFHQPDLFSEELRVES